MRNYNSKPGHRTAAGFTLPAILVVVAALLILAVGILLMVGIERSTARSFVDRERAELAARAGLEEVRGIFNKDAANDDFLIMQSALSSGEVNAFVQSEGVDKPSDQGKDAIPYLYLARGSEKGYRYTPIFSTENLPDSKSPDSGSEVDLKPAPPEIMDLLGSNAARSNGKAYAKFGTLPYHNDVRASWIPIKAEKDKSGKEKVISRYAYWVEDLQSRVDARTAGNTEDDGAHKRYGWKAGDVSQFAKFPAPGLNAKPSKIGDDGRDTEPPLNQVALYALDPAAGAKDNSTLDKTIIDGRKFLVSPNSTLAVAGIEPPLTRVSPESRSGDENVGELVNKQARAVEESLAASIQPYDEQPLVPYSTGIASGVMGKPKLNLNSLLAEPPATAVDDMAAWIKKGLPKFEARKGAFPNDYLKTLAANAIDYADADKDPTVSSGPLNANSYRGLDAYPVVSEVILHMKYLDVATLKGRKVMLWQMILFVELWNHTNQKVEGDASVTYENKFTVPGIGAGTTGGYFDGDDMLADPAQSTAVPPLKKSDGYYWTGPLAVAGKTKVQLEPNQYQFYRAVTVNYAIDVGSSSAYIPTGTQFSLRETQVAASGISLKWNNKIVDRSNRLLRGKIGDSTLDFKVGTKRQLGQAQIPGHSYGFPGGLFKDVMGDPRQSIYLLGDDLYPLSNNSYPGNVSPNRRNIRNPTIYKNGAGSALVYGRVTPSDWPDGGHDTAVPSSALPMVAPSENDYDPANLAVYPAVTNALEGEAPTFISNRGRFYSATELGRIYDPLMFEPKYDNAADTKAILNGSIPSGQVSWPSVAIASSPSMYFGGGNTLRIGRPEHPMFDQPAKHVPALMPGDHAARLLDLFHAGKSRSDQAEDREGKLVRIEGNINVNTASRDALRAMAGGLLVSDPRLVKRTSETHTLSTMAAPVQPLEVSVPTKEKQGDVLADAIIRGRPYASPSEIAAALTEDSKVAFGNRDLLPDGNKVQWSDAAAEEAFDRVYESATVRSRNFRIWVVGQSISPTPANNTDPEVLAEVHKVYTVFADPGERKSDGTIDPTKFKIKITSESDF